jgi:protein-L-isoaspartate O-methyltransferase
MFSFPKLTVALIVTSLLASYACYYTDDNGSMQPTEGYPFLTDIEEIKGILKHRGIDTIFFRPGEFVADIGGGNGFIEAMLSMFHDSLTFYIQDIDSSVCNGDIIKEVVAFYQDVNGKPFTNRFVTVNGTDTETKLPKNTFDKIFMMWTYSYLKYPKVFISDVRNDLRDDGLFYVINPAVEESEYTNTLREKYGWNVSPLEKQINDIIDCGFELRQIRKNYEAGEYNQPIIMVFHKTVKSAN